jgi:outer membrane protein assembly factor BamA
VPWISDHFRSNYLDPITSSGSILKYSYEDLLITKVGYTFYYTNAGVNSSAPFQYSVRVGVETSGNLLNLLSEPLGFDKTDNDQYKFMGVAFAQYAKHDFAFTANWRLDRMNNFVAHVEWGLGVPYGNSESLPFEKRFFAGGANSVRGWAVRELGPGNFRGEDKTIDYIRQSGDIKLGASIEYRSKLFWKINGATFIDAGNIWTIKEYAEQPDGEFRFDTFYKQIAVSYGLGLRLDFGFFVLRLDGGMKAYDPSGQTMYQRLPLIHPSFSRDFAFHLAVGYPF